MMDASDYLEPLTSTPGEPQAAMIIAALNDQGIEAVAEGGLTAGFRAEAVGEVKVMVWHNDLEHARQALADYCDAAQDIDWGDVDLGEAE